MLSRLYGVLMMSALLAMPVAAAELTTDWIEPVAGAGESILGTEIRSVEQRGEETAITMTIPKTSVADSGKMAEIVVYGRRPDHSEPQLKVRHEWVADYDKDHYGLVLFLGKEGQVPLRLYFKGHDQE